MPTSTFLKPLPSTRMTLRPDQEEAVARIIDELKFNDRTQAVMACGTGKTVTAQRAAERIVAGKVDPVVLIAVPNLVLVDQMISDWRSQMIPGQEFSVLPVNSRTTKRGKNDDEFIVDIEGVTDDPETIAAFMAGAGRKLVVTTYQSMQHISDALALVRKRTPGFELDLIISDEAHRTAGQSKADQQSPFKLVLDNGAVPASKRVFMTATPRISKLNSKNDTDTAAASMGNPEVYGDRAITRSLRWAVEKKLLAPYRTYVVQISDGDLEAVLERNPILRLDGQKAEARQVAAAIALAKSAANNNLGGVVTYHSRIDAAQEFTRILRAVVDALPEGEKPSGKLTVGHINGSTPADERSNILATLDSSTRKAGDWSVVTNCSCLTEGVNVPSMDAIMFVDPRRSVVANVQAIGRPMRRDPNNPNKVASILLPVFVGAAQSAEEALESGAFEGVHEVLKSLKDIDDALPEMFVEEKARQAGVNDPIGVHEHSDGDLDDSGVADADIDALGGEASTPANGVVTLWAYEDSDGTLLGESAADALIHVVVPRTGKGATPSNWATWHRSLEVRLVDDALGRWEASFAVLKAFVEREGHADVHPNHMEDGRKLGSWVVVQRTRRESFNTERKDLLEALPGWRWARSPEEAWADGLATLNVFIEREGHADVPLRHVEDGVRLGAWVSAQRRQRDSLNTERKVHLEALPGWRWARSNRDAWNDGMALLKAFVEREGHTDVIHSHVEGRVKLGRWVSHQRMQRDSLSTERKAALESLPGWRWARSPEDAWADGLATLNVFIEREGHADVPNNYVEGEKKLGQWVTYQRTQRDSLNTERKAALESLPGWRWARSANDAWVDGMATLRVFVEREGHADVPDRHVEDGKKLGHWVNRQRSRVDSLSAERRAELDALPGWRWRGSADEAWAAGMERLKAFIEREGHVKVPIRHVEGGVKLGVWVRNKRYKVASLSAERKAELESLPGWRWKAKVGNP